MITSMYGLLGVSKLFQTPTIADVYTLYGDQRSNWPNIVGSGLPGNYVRGYAAGIFKLGADLTNLATLQDSDIMCGSVFVGSPSGGGSGRIVINGQIVGTLVIAGPALVDRVAMYMETSFVGESSLLQGLTGYAYNLELDAQGEYVIVESVIPTQVFAFDTKNTKCGWYVDEVTGAGAGVLVPDYPISVKPLSMYTPPNLTTTPNFQWSSLPLGALAFPNNPDITYYDRVAKTQLNVNLGGYEQSWISTDTEAYDQTFGIFYDLGYNKGGNTSIYLDGGKRDSGGYLNTGLVGYFTLTNESAIEAYTLLDQTSGSPVASAGLKAYPGVASINAWTGNTLVQALHFGQPVLFEMWYSKIPESNFTASLSWSEGAEFNNRTYLPNSQKDVTL